MDLNSDLGESLGAWTHGRRRRHAGHRQQRQRGLRLSRGRPGGILQTCARAAERGVVVGAHVAYPDLKGFGRRNMDVASAELVADVIYQIGALQGPGNGCRHHGALRQAAWRALQHHCARRAPGARRDRGHPCDRREPGPGRAGRLAPGAVGADAACAWWPRRLPTAPTRRRARWCRAAKKAPCCTTARSVAQRMLRLVREGVVRPSTAARCASRPTRSACTATAPAPWSMAREPCARCSRPMASRSPRSWPLPWPSAAGVTPR
jgi:hypothetical protein